jgi:hypothetical protein
MITKKDIISVSEFNSSGTTKFIELLRQRPKNLFAELEKLTEDSNYATSLPAKLAWSYPKDRLELAETLWKSFGDTGELKAYAGNTGVWNWLSARLFETLVDGDMTYVQKRKGEEIERWVLLETSRSFHRHHISGPFVAYRNNWPNVDAALSQLVGPVLELSEVAERISGKRELAYGSVAHLATLLYVDPKTRQIRSGITDKPGEAQQLSKFFKQLDLTVDYEAMSVKELLDFLPNNFSDLVKKVKKEHPHLR